MQDFLEFKRMLVPVLIQLLWALILAAAVVGGIGLVLIGIFDHETRLALWGVGAVLVVPIVTRVYLEIVVVVFRINETLTDVHKQLLDSQADKITSESPSSPG